MTRRSRVPGLNATWPCAAPFFTCCGTRTDNILQGFLFMRHWWPFPPRSVWLGMLSALFCESLRRISMISSLNAEWILREAARTWSPPSGQDFSHRCDLSDRAVTSVALWPLAARPLPGLSPFRLRGCLRGGGVAHGPHLLVPVPFQRRRSVSAPSRCPGWRLPGYDAGQEPAFGPSGVLATSLPAISLTSAFILTPFSLPLALPSFQGKSVGR